MLGGCHEVNKLPVPSEGAARNSGTLEKNVTLALPIGTPLSLKGA